MPFLVIDFKQLYQFCLILLASLGFLITLGSNLVVYIWQENSPFFSLRFLSILPYIKIE